MDWTGSRSFRSISYIIQDLSWILEYLILAFYFGEIWIEYNVLYLNPNVEELLSIKLKNEYKMRGNF